MDVLNRVSPVISPQSYRTTRFHLQYGTAARKRIERLVLETTKAHDAKETISHHAGRSNMF